MIILFEPKLSLKGALDIYVRIRCDGSHLKFALKRKCNQSTALSNWNRSAKGSNWAICRYGSIQFYLQSLRQAAKIISLGAICLAHHTEPPFRIPVTQCSQAGW